MNRSPYLLRSVLASFFTLGIASLAWSGDMADQQNKPILRVELVPAAPRPLTEPHTGPSPVPTIGGPRDVLPDPDRAFADPVSPESRIHLDALTREFRQR